MAAGSTSGTVITGVAPRHMQALNEALESGFFCLRDYLLLHRSLGLFCSLEDAILSCSVVSSDGENRLRFWKNLLGKNGSIVESLPCNSSTIEEFKSLLNIIEIVSNISSTPDSGKIDEQYAQYTKEAKKIEKDVCRTFRRGDLSESDRKCAENSLSRILRAIALKQHEIGYCQGMNYVAATLLLSRLSYPSIVKSTLVNVNNSCENVGGETVSSNQFGMIGEGLIQVEFEVYEVMVILIDSNGKFNMSGLWGADVPKYKLMVYQLNKLLAMHLPDLHSHFEKLDLALESIIASQWLLTLFSYTFHWICTGRLWDYIFYGGLSAMFSAAIAFLALLESDLLALDCEGCLDILKGGWENSDVDDLKTIPAIMHMTKADFDKAGFKSCNISRAFVKQEAINYHYYGRYSSSIPGVREAKTEKALFNFRKYTVQMILQRTKSISINNETLKVLQETYFIELAKTNNGSSISKSNSNINSNRKIDSDKEKSGDVKKASSKKKSDCSLS